MVGEGVLCVTNLLEGTLILCAILGGTGLSTLGGAGYPSLCVADVCYTLGGAPNVFGWA